MGAPPCQAAWTATAVFAGTVVDLTREQRPPDEHGVVQMNGYLGTQATFDVAEGFVGMSGRGRRVLIRTGMGGGDCGYGFRLGQTYVVYAYSAPDGRLTTGICTRTALIENAGDDLAYLRSLSSGLPASFVAGVAGPGESGLRLDALGQRVPVGVAGASVTITGEGTTTTGVADSAGWFRLEVLPGKYTVSASKGARSSEGAQQPTTVTVHPGGCAYAFLPMAVDRRIVGTVTSVDGRPVAGIHVEIVRRRLSRPKELPTPVQQARNGPDGKYEFRAVPPGDYYLGVNLLHSPYEAMPYTRYFYPGTEDPAGSKLIIVGDAPGTNRYDFSLPPRQESRAVRGTVVWPDGRPAAGVGILLEDPRLPWQPIAIVTRTDAEGRFQAQVFDRTAYRVHAVNFARIASDVVSAEPLLIVPPTHGGRAVRLVLTQKGDSTKALREKGLDGWRAAFGL
jgi:hypothetical protein